ncbi:Na+/H+ antiporter NhaA [Granulosicoccus antarcticus]|uniref:Na(+)/H(+) antiporter NhaA n=1 Tax=Granulosicoccus antarcticus IMCC3135 TaxID=1192854 RepID=A0A2Z2P7I6_9GAMM|nr:Na+/H+ antiporter NhaA [Granulosicoccus antarcticus]ASJ75804.1 Na(+)/H(+) antiporter NhaA [Granulosicoccus antarcticus IMCC3135]
MPINALQRFIKLEAAAGILLFLAAAASMIVANSSLAGFMSGVLDARAAVIIGALSIDKSVLLWINDGLMAVFFLLVGLELKREVLEGQLSDRSQLALPVVGALGGFMVPALIFTLFNLGDATALKGWAIPSATDIAFALGVLSLFGSRIPLSVKVFLASLAIIDDLAAIVVIALFYTSDLSLVALGVAAVGIVGLVALNVFNVTRTAAYILIGVVIWIAVLKSGIHATLAGVIVALAIPLTSKSSSQTAGVRAERKDSPLRSLEHALHPWVGYGILPLFAFANAGVSLEGITWEMLMNPLTLGIAVGLFLGKQVGVFIPIWLGVKARLLSMPDKSTMLMLYGTALVTGIGFTMSFFIGSLAYENLDQSFANSMKLGVLGGSMLSLIFGILVLWISTRKVTAQATDARKY